MNGLRSSLRLRNARTDHWRLRSAISWPWHWNATATTRRLRHDHQATHHGPVFGDQLFAEAFVRAVATNFDELQAAFRARAEQLAPTRLELDELCKTTGGYMGKFLGLRQVRKAHMGTIGKVLRGLGLRLVVVEDEQATRKILRRITPRDSSRVRHRRAAELPTATGAAA
jgi:hypothetical protein